MRDKITKTMAEACSKLFGEHECENCPCAWEDRSYEGECNDCGCVIYGGLHDGNRPACLLPDFIKIKIRNHFDNKKDEAMAREYDVMAEWFEASMKKDQAMQDALRAAFPSIIFEENKGFQLRMSYEDKFSNNGPSQQDKNKYMLEALREAVPGLEPGEGDIMALIQKYEELAPQA